MITKYDLLFSLKPFVDSNIITKFDTMTCLCFQKFLPNYVDTGDTDSENDEPDLLENGNKGKNAGKENPSDDSGNAAGNAYAHSDDDDDARGIEQEGGKKLEAYDSVTKLSVYDREKMKAGLKCLMKGIQKKKDQARSFVKHGKDEKGQKQQAQDMNGNNGALKKVNARTRGYVKRIGENVDGAVNGIESAIGKNLANTLRVYGNGKEIGKIKSSLLKKKKEKSANMNRIEISSSSKQEVNEDDGFRTENKQVQWKLFMA